MPVLQSDIDALTAAINNPEKQVAHGAVQVTYRSVDELIRARSELIRQKALEDAAGAKPASRITYITQFGRGYHPTVTGDW